MTFLTKLLKSFFLLLNLILICQISNAQSIRNLLFNSKDNVVGLNFSGPSPTVFYTNTNSGGGLGEGLAHYEKNGSLIFYVNSNGVYDKNYIKMPGSVGIFANPSSTEINICPFPGDSNKYFIFYNQETHTPLYYSVVDMNLRSGLGDVISLNTLLDAAQFAEGIEVIRKPCTPYFWLVAYQYQTGFKRFFIDSTGIQPGVLAHSFNCGPPFDGRGELEYHQGKIGMAYAWNSTNNAFLVDFNAGTGAFSNPKPLTLPASGIYGLEFSPDGSKVFFSDWYNSFSTNLYQYDFSSNSIINQWAINISSCGFRYGLGEIEMGPNGKLYIPEDEGCRIVEVSDPNSNAPSFNYIPVGNVLSLGVSDFIQSDVYQVSVPSTYVVCSGDSTTIAEPIPLTERYWVVDTSLYDTIATAPSIKIAANGQYNYIVTGKDELGCVKSFTFIFYPVPPPLVTATSDEDTICLNGSVTLFGNAVPATQPYSYYWGPNVGVANPTSANTNASPPYSMSYVLYATDTLGCIGTDTVDLIVVPSNISNFNALSSKSAICTGDSAQLNVEYSKACTLYEGTCAGISGNANLGNGIFSDNGVYVSPFSGSYESSKKQFIYLASELVANGLKANDVIKNIAFNVVGSSGGTYDNFTVKMACTSNTSASGFFENNLHTVYNPKSYTVVFGWNTLTFDKGYQWDGVSNIVVDICYENSTIRTAAAVEYTSNSFYSTTYYYNSASVCNSSSGYTFFYRPNTKFGYCTPVGDFVFTWSPASYLNNAAIKDPMAKPLSSVTYLVTMNDPANVCKFKDSVTIKVAAPFPINATEDTLLCVEDSLQLNVTLPTPANYTYLWSPAIKLNNNLIASPKSYTSTSEVYIVAVRRDSACTLTDTVNVIVAPNVNMHIVSSANSVCAGDSIQLQAILQDDFSDDFDPLPDTTLWNSISGGGTSTVCGSYSGSALYFSGSFNRYAETHDLGVSSGGNISFYLKFGTGFSPCENADFGEDVSLEYSTNGGASWNLINTYLVSNYSSLTKITAPIPAGAKTANTRFRWRQVNFSGSDFDIWILDNVSISTSVNISDLDFVWTPAALVSNPVISNPKGYPVSDTKFIVSISHDATSCTVEDSILITVFPLPSVNIGDTLEECMGKNISLNAGNPGSSYTWSNGSSSQGISVSASGNYWVSVRDVNGCIGKDTAHVIFDPNPVVNLQNLYTSCGQADLVLDAGPDGVTYDWSTGEATQQITVSSSGNYKVEVTNEFDCVTKDSSTYTIFPAVAVSLGLDTSTTVCEEEDLISLNATQPDIISYNWSNGATTSTITVEDPGQYWVVIRSSNNCLAKDTINVTYNFLPPNFFIPNLFTPDKDGYNEAFNFGDVHCIREFHIEIFNRWGSKVFESRDPSFQWYAEGNNDGIYFYHAVIKGMNKTEQTFKGWVSIVR